MTHTVDRLRLLFLRLQAEPGQTMAEYALLIGVIALIILAAALFLGTGLSTIFKTTASHI